MTPEQRENVMADSKGTTIPQDYLGDINEKSVIELQELLIRQEKLLRNVKFLAVLPDKGQKIKNMAARLESLIHSRKEVEATTDLFEKMALNAAEARRVPPLHDDSEISLLKMMANRSEGKVYVDERTELQDSNNPTYVNSYDRVIRQAENRPSKPSTKFFPNRSIKHKDVSNLPIESIEKLRIGDQHTEAVTRENKRSEETSSKVATTSSEEKASNNVETAETKPNLEGNERKPIEVASQTGSKDMSVDNKVESETNRERKNSGRHKFVYDESLVATNRWHSPTHGPAKMISIEESIMVLEKQQAAQEALKAQQAAEKLAQRLHINMASFDPEGSRNLAYRDTKTVESDDEDSDDVEDDYPEGDGE